MKDDLGPVLNLVNLMPTVVPPLSTGGVRGEKGVGAIKNVDQGEVVGNVMSTQLPTSMTKTFVPITSTTTTTRPLSKGIVIGGSSSSKPLQSN